MARQGLAQGSRVQASWAPRFLALGFSTPHPGHTQATSATFRTPNPAPFWCSRAQSGPWLAVTMPCNGVCWRRWSLWPTMTALRP